MLRLNAVAVCGSLQPRHSAGELRRALATAATPTYDQIDWAGQPPVFKISSSGIFVGEHKVEELIPAGAKRREIKNPVMRLRLRRALVATREAMQAALASGALPESTAGEFQVEVDPEVQVDNLFDVLQTADAVGFQRFTLARPSSPAPT